MRILRRFFVNGDALQEAMRLSSFSRSELVDTRNETATRKRPVSPSGNKHVSGVLVLGFPNAYRRMTSVIGSWWFRRPELASLPTPPFKGEPCIESLALDSRRCCRDLDAAPVNGYQLIKRIQINRVIDNDKSIH